jgi:cytochrome c553
VVDPRWGPDAQEAARKISKTPTYRDPWAFSEELFLAAAGNSIVLMNGAGATQEVVKLPPSDLDRKLTPHEPRPLAARPRERIIPTRADLARDTGRLVLSDVYQGRNMGGVRRGEIKKLLVLETLPMPIHYTGGMEPITMGGSFTLERIVGTVPVEADGSAYFELPALRSFFFVALDEQDLSVKRMQSFMTVQPGETTSCVGCHEQRESAPPPAGQTLAALGRAPSRIAPIADVPDVFDFPRDIQPILDRRCVSCHDFPHPSGGVVLAGDRGPVYSHSYIHLTLRAQVADGRNRAKSNYPPRALGSSASPLMHKLFERHHGVAATAHEIKMVRLWIESGAAYPGTYAALGSGMIGAYGENQLSRPDTAWPPVQASGAALARRCGSCHGKDKPLPLTPSDDQKLPPWNPLQARDPRRQFSRHVLYNLTRPEMSPLLLAALARAGGGWGLCRGAAFSAPTDPDYGLILAGIREAAGKLAEMKRFDMPGFVPRVDWVREMKRFGVLPAAHDPAAPVDYYAAERRYWESLWYRPEAR